MFASPPLLSAVAFYPRVVTHRPYANQTTAVMLGYSTKRTKNVRNILLKLSKMHGLFDRLVLVWNNQVVPQPVFSEAIQGDVPIIVIQSQRNSLNSRYNVSALVRTQSVFVIDDDVRYTRPAIERLMATFTASPNSGVVGFQHDARHISRDGEYHIPTPRNASLNMIIGKTMLFAREHMTSYITDSNLTNQVEEGGICAWCDDIALNALVMHHTKSTVVALPLKMSERHRLPEFAGVSSKKGWRSRRSRCARWLIQHFGWDGWPEGRQRELRCWLGAGRIGSGGHWGLC